VKNQAAAKKTIAADTVQKKKIAAINARPVKKHLAKRKTPLRVVKMKRKNAVKKMQTTKTPQGNMCVLCIVILLPINRVLAQNVA